MVEEKEREGGREGGREREIIHNCLGSVENGAFTSCVGNLNDPLAVAYQLVMDNRVVNQAAHDALTGTSHEPVQSISPPNTQG